MRAVLDPNILIAALLSPSGAPAQLISRWLGGEFELVVFEGLLSELERALAYPKLRRRPPADDAAQFVSLLRLAATLVPDPEAGAHRSADSGDDYVLALAENESSILVSGDRHLLDLADDLPIQTARALPQPTHRRVSGALAVDASDSAAYERDRDHIESAARSA